MDARQRSERIKEKRKTALEVRLAKVKQRRKMKAGSMMGMDNKGKGSLVSWFLTHLKNLSLCNNQCWPDQRGVHIWQKLFNVAIFLDTVIVRNVPVHIAVNYFDLISRSHQHQTVQTGNWVSLLVITQISWKFDILVRCVVKSDILCHFYFGQYSREMTYLCSDNKNKFGFFLDDV